MKLRGKKSWSIKNKKDAVKMNSVRLKNSGPQSLKGKANGECSDAYKINLFTK